MWLNIHFSWSFKDADVMYRERKEGHQSLLEVGTRTKALSETEMLFYLTLIHFERIIHKANGNGPPLKSLTCFLGYVAFSGA